MKKFNVIGTTGTGKSTFSSRLAKQIRCPHIQMDQLFWKENWQESHDDEFFPKVQQAVSGSAWVLDGNYSRTSRIKWDNVDAIIWLDYSYYRTLIQLLNRTVKRIASKQELWPETGNVETFRKSFLSRDSILMWFFKTYKKNKQRYSELMESPELRHVKFVRLRSPQEASQFIESVRLGKKPSAIGDTKPSAYR